MDSSPTLRRLAVVALEPVVTLAEPEAIAKVPGVLTMVHLTVTTPSRTILPTTQVPTAINLPAATGAAVLLHLTAVHRFRRATTTRIMPHRATHLTRRVSSPRGILPVASALRILQPIIQPPPNTLPSSGVRAGRRTPHTQAEAGEAGTPVTEVVTGKRHV